MNPPNDLRDWFAGLAMQRILAALGADDLTDFGRSESAKDAYRMADWMLEIRKRYPESMVPEEEMTENSKANDR